MIEELLPAAVASAESFGPPDAAPGELYPEERALVAGAVDARRREFAAGRACARRALARLAVPPAAVLRGERGEPRRPRGTVGSITHCAGYQAAAVAPEARVAAVGIDAEPNRPLPPGVRPDVVTAPEEEAMVRRLAGEAPDIHWDRLLFSAKESVYKVWSPLSGGGWLDFDEAVVAFDRRTRQFTAGIVDSGARRGHPSFARLTGRWAARGGLLLTAVTVAPALPFAGGTRAP
ncbi:4'-phosphopantetheinyl transferase [Streptomyces sp. NPDC059534]|uniref:4'-phosphopantetheinyl transferase family protein n=1 Tax=Streptomyces sp. NPDC059534 TaxID=3346859 RepID=UPI003683F77F